MNTTVTCYVIYLAISFALTVWVAHTLHKNGRVILQRLFPGNQPMGDAVNQLLVVGFYLINLGYAVLTLKFGQKPTDVQQAFEFLGTKLGMVLLVLGAIHFFTFLISTIFTPEPQAKPAPGMTGQPITTKTHA